MKRQWLSAVLIGAMMTTSVPAFAAENTGETTPEAPTLPFTDVSEGDWFYDPVVYAYDEGLMTGTSATEFAPNVTMTRAMIVSVLYRLEGSPDLSEGNLGYPYEDVEGDAWYAMPVYWARESGVMAGYSDSTFGPNDRSPANSSPPPFINTPSTKAKTSLLAPISAATATLQRSATGQKKC